MAVKRTEARNKIPEQNKITNPSDADLAMGKIGMLEQDKVLITNSVVSQRKDLMYSANDKLNGKDNKIDDEVRDLQAFAESIELQKKTPRSIKLTNGRFGYKKDADRWDWPNKDIVVQNIQENTRLSAIEKEMLYDAEEVTTVKYSLDKKAILALLECENGALILAELGLEFIKGYDNFFTNRDPAKEVKEFNKQMDQFPVGDTEE